MSAINSRKDLVDNHRSWRSDAMKPAAHHGDTAARANSLRVSGLQPIQKDVQKNPVGKVTCTGFAA
jgi:hypothetical protein